MVPNSELYYFANKAKDEVLVAPTSPIKEYIDIVEVQIGNSSGSDAKAGWGHSILDADWKFGLWDDNANSGDGSFTDDTTDAQDAGTNDTALGLDVDDNTGFVVLAKQFPNIIKLAIATAEAGSASTAVVEYWSTSGWATLTTIEVPDYTATGDQYLVALKPVDADLLASGDVPVDTAGADAGYFAVKVRFSTAAGTSAPIATDLSLVKLLDYVEKVADGTASVEREYLPGTLRIPAGCSFIPYCSTANAANWVKVKWSKGQG